MIRKSIKPPIDFPGTAQTLWNKFKSQIMQKQSSPTVVQRKGVTIAGITFPAGLQTIELADRVYRTDYRKDSVEHVLKQIPAGEYTPLRDCDDRAKHALDETIHKPMAPFPGMAGGEAWGHIVYDDKSTGDYHSVPVFVFNDSGKQSFEYWEPALHKWIDFKPRKVFF